MVHSTGMLKMADYTRAPTCSSCPPHTTCGHSPQHGHLVPHANAVVTSPKSAVDLPRPHFPVNPSMCIENWESATRGARALEGRGGERRGTDLCILALLPQLLCHKSKKEKGGRELKGIPNQAVLVGFVQVTF